MIDPQVISIGMWAIEHIPHVAVVVFIWKASRFATKLETRAISAEQNINLAMSNHLPHIEASLSNQDGLMKSMDDSLKTIAQQGCKFKVRRAYAKRKR